MPSTAHPTVSVLFTEALRFHRQGDLDQAEPLYRDVLQQQSQHADALHLLGVTYLQRQQYNVAIDLIQQALAVEPNNVLYIGNLASALLQQGRYVDALTLIEQLLLLSPSGSFDLFCHQAAAMTAMGRLEEAITSYDKAIAIQPQLASVYVFRAEILLRLQRFVAARADYEQALAIEPNHVVACHRLASILLKMDEEQQGRELYQRAMALAPYAEDIIYNYANDLLSLGYIKEAIDLYEQSLTLNPRYIEALHNRGMALLNAGRYDEALHDEAKAIALNPKHAQAQNGYGNILIAKKEIEAALPYFQRAVALNSHYVAAWINLGSTLMQLKRYQEALQAYEQGVQFDTGGHGELQFGRANALEALGRTEDSIRAFDQVVLTSERYLVLFNQGIALTKVGRYEEALSNYNEAIEIHPDYPEALNNRAGLWLRFHQYDKALADYERVVTVRGHQTVETLNNIGMVYFNAGEPEQALGYYQQSIDMNPSSPFSYWHRALARLLMGDLNGGFSDYEWRWQGGVSDEIVPRVYPGRVRLEKGDPLVGKRIFVFWEQGLGDTLQFIRYVWLLLQRGAQVVAEVQGPLLPLLEASLPKEVIWLKSGDVFPDFDYYVPLMSLPYCLETTLETIPCPVPYLCPDTQKREYWQRAIMRCEAAAQAVDVTTQRRKLRVGLSWAGSALHRNNHNRSIALSMLTSLFDLPNVTWFSVQKELPKADLVCWQAHPQLFDFTPAMVNFSDTAAFISTLDLLISVDTAVVHLAGALGVPVWVMLPFNPDWRWLRARSDSPWYPSATLFRQTTSAVDWSDVVGRVRQALLNKSQDRVVANTASVDRSYFNAVLALHREGNYEAAAVGYRELLQQDPHFFDALHLLGVTFVQQKNYEDAITLIDRALLLNPQHASAWSNKGSALLSLERYAQAKVCIERALSIQPTHIDALGNFGSVLMALGEHVAAECTLDRLLTLQPDHLDALQNRAALMFKIKRYDAALTCYEHLLRLCPKHMDALCQYGNTLTALLRFDVSVAWFEQRVLTCYPEHALSLRCYADALKELRRYDEAFAMYEKAMQCGANPADMQQGMGDVLSRQGLYLDALAIYDDVLVRHPGHVGVMSNRCGVLVTLNRLEEAKQGYERALSLAPDRIEIQWNEGLLALLMGNLALGFERYELRWQGASKEIAARQCVRPLWALGECLSDRVILLHAEQGLGDTLQFIRYVPLVAAQAAGVIVEVQSALYDLCRASLPQEIEVIARGEPTSRSFDVHCPLLSLPHRLGTTLENVPAQTPYLVAHSTKVDVWNQRLTDLAKGRRRVGFVWSGSVGHRNDLNRSMTLSLATQLLARTDIALFSLHKEYRAVDLDVMVNNPGLIDLSSNLNDFSDTAAIVQNLDLVISVDTAIAHLAGALAKPVWVLLPLSSDWRWLTEREDSPWYSSARLFRQTQRGDWAGVMRQVSDALDNVLSQPV